jgi:hypothetical protein
MKDAEIAKKQLDTSRDLVEVSASYKVKLDSPMKEIKSKMALKLMQIRTDRMSDAYGHLSDEERNSYNKQ